MKTRMLFLILMMQAGMIRAQLCCGLYPAPVTAGGFWSLFGNQAGLAGIKTATCGLSTCRPYLLKELEFSATGIVLPVRPGVIAVSYSEFGYSLLRKDAAGLAFAKNFGKYFSASVQLDYLTTSMAEPYGSLKAPAYEAGFLCRPGGKLAFGGHIFKAAKAGIGMEDEAYPPQSSFGLAYTVSRQLNIYAGISKDLYNDAEMDLGFLYNSNDQVKAGLEFRPKPLNASFCVGFRLGGLMMSMVSAWDPILGYSPGIGLEYSFRKHENTRSYAY